MGEPLFYQVTWTPSMAVDALAKEWGLSEDESRVEAALECETEENFKVYRLARKAAMKRSKECFWGHARIYTCIDRDEFGDPIFAEEFQEFDHIKNQMRTI